MKNKSKKKKKGLIKQKVLCSRMFRVFFVESVSVEEICILMSLKVWKSAMVRKKFAKKQAWIYELSGSLCRPQRFVVVASMKSLIFYPPKLPQAIIYFFRLVVNIAQGYFETDYFTRFSPKSKCVGVKFDLTVRPRVAYV